MNDMEILDRILDLLLEESVESVDELLVVEEVDIKINIHGDYYI